MGVRLARAMTGNRDAKTCARWTTARRSGGCASRIDVANVVLWLCSEAPATSPASASSATAGASVLVARTSPIAFRRESTTADEPTATRSSRSPRRPDQAHRAARRRARADTLGLRLEIASATRRGVPLRPELREYLTAAFSDEVRTHDGPQGDHPGSATSSCSAAPRSTTPTAQGLVIRNPNRPSAPVDRGAHQRRRAVGRDRDAGRRPRSTRRWPPTAASSPTSATTARARRTSRWAAAATAAR